MKIVSSLTPILLLFSVSTFASPKSALTDYAFAQKCYHSLDKTSAKGWDRCVKQFKNIVADYPKSEEAPKALFSVARLSQEKYEVTKDIEDLQKAFSVYNEFLKAYEKHPLADDALYRIAILRFEKQNDKPKAQRALKALLERYPDGDMAKGAEDYLQKVSPQPVISITPEKGEEPAPKPRSETDFNIKTVVIDPGHGGDDPGAMGPKGTKEAQVALQIARKLSFKLKNDLKLDTYLTRTKNRSLSLEERNAFANKKGADLFISIHANANDSPKVGGVQVFYLNNATSKAAERLAARENKVAKKRLDLSQQILTTMLQNANTEESRDLARTVQASLVRHLNKTFPPVKDLKVDSALFYVLVGAKSPSILVETSFITNPTEEKKLRDSGYQWAVTEGMAQGIKKYIESRQKVATSL